MDQVSGWDFTLANYPAVWAFMVQLGLLLLFLMLGNILRRTIPLFRKCLVPSALLGGTLLLIANVIAKQFDFVLVDNRLMQVITYHCLAIGFAAMTLKTEKSTHKTNKAQVVEFGALQGGCYMLQAFVLASSRISESRGSSSIDFRSAHSFSVALYSLNFSIIGVSVLYSFINDAYFS